MTNKRTNILIGAALVYKERGKKRFYWLVTDKEGKWEIPKVTVRRGESSPRAVIRMTGEQAGMNSRILEEVGRQSGVVTVNSKTMVQKTLYYLMVFKSAGEVLGFAKHQWLNYKDALKILPSKKEKEAVRTAEEMLRKWEKEKKKR